MELVQVVIKTRQAICTLIQILKWNLNSLLLLSIYSPGLVLLSGSRWLASKMMSNQLGLFFFLRAASNMQYFELPASTCSWSLNRRWSRSNSLKICEIYKNNVLFNSPETRVTQFIEKASNTNVSLQFNHQWHPTYLTACGIWLSLEALRLIATFNFTFIEFLDSF